MGMVQDDFFAKQMNSIEQYADHLIKCRGVKTTKGDRTKLIQGLKELLHQQKKPNAIALGFIAEFVPKTGTEDETYEGDVAQLERDFGI